MTNSDETKCLVCGTTKSKKWVQGLCVSCYNSLYNELQKFNSDEEREIAEQTLIDQGMLLPRQRKGRKHKNPKFEKVIRVLKKVKAEIERQETVEKSEELLERLGRKVAEDTDDYPATKAKPKKGSK